VNAALARDTLSPAAALGVAAKEGDSLVLGQKDIIPTVSCT